MTILDLVDDVEMDFVAPSSDFDVNLIVVHWCVFALVT